MNINIKKLAYSSVFLALSIILGYVESMFPISFNGIGLKIGISNIVTMCSIYYLGKIRTFFIVLLRVIIVMILFTNIVNGIYSLAGFLFSYFIMIICYNIFKFDNHVVVSIYGGVMHNIGQIVIALIFIKDFHILYFLPIYIISGIIAGFIVGIISNTLISNVKYIEI